MSLANSLKCCGSVFNKQTMSHNFLQVYRQFYTETEESELGVIAFQVGVVLPDE